MSTACPHPTTRSRARSLSLSPSRLLWIVVAASAVTRFALVLQRESPRYLPDEFLYVQLARSLGRGDGVQVLGEAFSFPALLEPLLTAVFWRSDDAELAYRSVQALHAVLLSLTAVPVFVLARRLRVSGWIALAVAVVTLLAPGMLYVGFATADALGLLLALVALDAGVRALSRPSRATEAVFLVAAALATFTRLQYVVLVPAFALAALLVDRGRVARAARRVPVTFTTLGVGALGLAVLPGALGRYDSVTSFGVSRDTGGWVASNVFLVAIVAGAATVPAAVAWVGLRIARPSSVERTAFAALTATTMAGLVVASAVMAVETVSNRFFERYLLIAAPLVALAFAAWVAERRPAGRAAALGGVVMLAAVSAVPVSGYAVGQGRADSPSLLAVGKLADQVGTANASLVTAIVVSMCALVAIAVALVPRIPAWPAVAAVAMVFVTASTGAHLADWDGSRNYRQTVFDGRPDWVQASGARDVLLVQTPWSGRLNAMITSLWNPGITDVTSVGDDIDPVDGLGEAAELLPDGMLLEAGRVVTRPVLLASYGTHVVFDESVTTVRDHVFTLGIPTAGPPRIASLAAGMRVDGTTAVRGRLTIFPSPTGECRSLAVRVTVLPGLPSVTVELRRGLESPRRVLVRGSEPLLLTVTSAETTPGTLDFVVTKIGSRSVVPSPLVQALGHGPVTTTTAACEDTGKGLRNVGPVPIGRA